VPYLTKTDVEIAIKAVWDIGKWILRGANPMEPFEDMTYERKTVIEDSRIPEGYVVTHHELRGYDSPDKWYEAYKGDEHLSEFSRGPKGKEDAIQYCIDHSKGWKQTELGARFKVVHVNESHPDNHWIVLDISPEHLETLYKEILVMREFQNAGDTDNITFWSLYFDVEPEHPCVISGAGKKTRRPSLLVEEAVNE
jgi:hypothetical protein